jgi:hypothetical protein
LIVRARARDPSRRRSLARLLALAASSTLLSTLRAQSLAPSEVRAELTAPRLQGQGRLTFFGLTVYEARLWVDGAFRPDAATTSPLALELVYARRLHGEAIAERSLAEIRRQGALEPARAEAWLASMRGVFVDVHAGDRMTGVHRPGESARFFHNGAAQGEVRDPAFAQAFFSIWLGPATSEPGLRRALLGTPA